MIGLDCASSEFFEDGKYVMKKSSGKALTAEEWIAVLEDWVNKYPIISIEDGMAEGDWEGWAFLPEGEKVVVKPKPKKPAYANYLMPPPETITVDSTATEVMTTKVSGIMYDKFNPSAILNISGSDYLVRTGDVINGYKILSIGKETVTVQYGSNVYKASVGELFTGEGINFNTVSNLNRKFGSNSNKR